MHFSFASKDFLCVSQGKSQQNQRKRPKKKFSPKMLKNDRKRVLALQNCENRSKKNKKKKKISCVFLMDP